MRPSRREWTALVSTLLWFCKHGPAAKSRRSQRSPQQTVYGPTATLDRGSRGVRGWSQTRRRPGGWPGRRGGKGPAAGREGRTVAGLPDPFAGRLPPLAPDPLNAGGASVSRARARRRRDATMNGRGPVAGGAGGRGDAHRPTGAAGGGPSAGEVAEVRGFASCATEEQNSEGRAGWRRPPRECGPLFVLQPRVPATAGRGRASPDLSLVSPAARTAL